MDDCYAACELSKTLLELLTVKLGCGFLELMSDLVDSCLDSLGVACAVNNDGVLF